MVIRIGIGFRGKNSNSKMTIRCTDKGGEPEGNVTIAVRYIGGLGKISQPLKNVEIKKDLYKMK